MMMSQHNSIVLTAKMFNYTRLNQSDGCRDWLKSLEIDLFTRIIFKVFAPIMLSVGFLGNLIGFLIALGQETSPRLILTRAFYGANMANCVVMIAYPVLDTVGQFNLKPFWFTYSWKYYMSRVHFVIAKSFVNFSLGIYVFFALTQLVAVYYPLFYQRLLQRRNVWIGLGLIYIYITIWFVPVSWWFAVKPIQNACSEMLCEEEGSIHRPNSSMIYLRVYAIYGTKITNWFTVYGVFRETFTKFIPVFTMVSLKLLLLHKHRNMMRKIRRKSENPQTTSPLNGNSCAHLREMFMNQGIPGPDKNANFILGTANLFLQPPNNSSLNSSVTNLAGFAMAKIRREIMVGRNRGKTGPITPTPLQLSRNQQYVLDGKLKISSNQEPNNTENSSNVHNGLNPVIFITSSEQRYLKKEAMYKMDLKLTIIITLQCIIFLFPVSFFIMTVDLFGDRLIHNVDKAFAICTLLEYLFVTLTFYLNVTFNMEYRKLVVMKCLKAIQKLRGINCKHDS